MLPPQRAKTADTVAAGGNSTGSCRHPIPPRTIYRMAATITRRQSFSGRPPRPAVLPGAGNSGTRIAHSASVTDDEYTAQPCPPAAWGGHDGQGEIGDDGMVGSWSGRRLGNHRPNQEPTSSVLREPHTRPSRVLKHSLRHTGRSTCCKLVERGCIWRIRWVSRDSATTGGKTTCATPPVAVRSRSATCPGDKAQRRPLIRCCAHASAANHHRGAHRTAASGEPGIASGADIFGIGPHQERGH
jgi:hypothetical protein